MDCHGDHDFDVDLPCAARRHRERRLRAFFRHEKLTVAMTMATVLHHSRDKGTRVDQKAFLLHACTETTTFTDAAACAATASAPVIEFVAPAPVTTDTANFLEPPIPS